MKITLKISAAAILLAAAACGDKQTEPQADPAPAPSANDIQPVEAAPPSAADEAAASRYCVTVGVNGYCGAVFGMTDDQASSAFPGGLFGEPFGDVESKACYYKSAVANDYSILFMFVYGALERIDISAHDIETDVGAKIGMSLDDVEALYPGATREPNFYMAPAENLIADLGGGVLAIFEEDEAGVVTTFRVGRKPAVEFVEGCS